MEPSRSQLNPNLSTAESTGVAGKAAFPGQALIFDMDGVLCDTMPYHLKAWGRYIAENPELSDSLVEHLDQMGGKRNSELLRELLGNQLSEEDIRCWGSGKEAVYRDLIRHEIVWLPGLVEFLERSRLAGFKLGLGTSACQENVDLLLSHQDLLNFFETTVIETDVQRGKPDPQCYLLVAERLGVAPQSCLVFEDATAGVRSARNAGMRCWGVLTTQTEAELLSAGAELCIRDFTDPRLATLLALSVLGAGS